MPTIIALDTSLSMQRIIPGRSENYNQLACKGISQLLEILSSNIVKLEYVAFATYSMGLEVKVDFTRDYDQIKHAVKKVEPGDKLCLISMLKSIAGIMSSNWGNQNFCQVVVFTDCGLGFGSTALQGFLQSYVGNEKKPEFAWIEMLKPVKLNFICMGLQSDSYFTRATPLYQQLIDFAGLKGTLYIPKSNKDSLHETPDISNESSLTSSKPLTHKSELGRTIMLELIEKVCEANYKPYEAILKCGSYFRLECPIVIWPPPVAPTSQNPITGEKIEHTLHSKLEVCGYLALSEIGSPASLSRHLIVPKIEREKPFRRSSDKSGSRASLSSACTTGNGSSGNEFEKLEQDIRDFYTKEAKDTDESGDDADVTNTSTKSSTPNEMQRENMCVLMHGALKVENMAGVVEVGDNWYGFLYSHADSKKKSNLMLNILPPGSNIIPWLGDLQQLGFAEDLLPGDSSSFPVKAEKRSYSQSCVVWIRHGSLQSDVQKVLRHAKKMPEKTQHFYKELNRIRRAALSIGFVELLEAMATLFEKECLTLSSNPECALQLRHASLELRKPSNRDLKVSILPIQKFDTTTAGTSAAAGVLPQHYAF